MINAKLEEAYGLLNTDCPIGSSPLHMDKMQFYGTKFQLIIVVLTFISPFSGTIASCGQGMSNKVRACPYTPPGLQLTRGLAGHCPVGTDLIGDCITDDDCFLKKLGNVCCYNRCRGITECHRFP